MSYSIKATAEQIKELLDYYQAYLTYSENTHTIARARTDHAVITFYTTNTVLFQGSEGSREYFYWADKWNLSPVSSQATDQYQDLSVIGSDEVGTGDYFGPIVVCSTFVATENVNALKRLGVKDSKLLTDSQIIEIALRIKDIIPYVILVLSPERINRLRTTNEDNMNFVKANLHNNAINSILKKYPDVKYDAIIIDGFTTSEKYYQHLHKNPNPVRGIVMVQKGEKAHVAVAAASILARAAFLKEMKDLSKKCQVELMKGASRSVDRQAIDLVKCQGLDILKRIAKFKFSNTKRVIQYFSDNKLKMKA